MDNLHGWAVGHNGTIVATVDGGDNWTAQTSGTTQQLRGLFFLNQDTGWVVGGFSSLVVLNTTDGGASWSDLETVIPEEVFLKEIQFADADHGYALALSHIFYSADGGLSWEKGTYNAVIHSDLNARGLYVTSDTSAFVCGTYKTSSSVKTRPGVFQNFTNSEGEWVPHGAGDFDTDDVLTAIHFTDAQKGFTGGMNGKLYEMEETGGIFPGVWENNFDSGSGLPIYSINFPTNDQGMFNTFTEIDGQTIALVFHTADAGVTWSSAPDSISGILSATLSAPDSINAWIAGSAGQIFKGEPKDPTSVSDHASFDFSISPNPFIYGIRIESPDSYQGVQLSVFSYTGQVMKSVFIEDLQETYELEGLDFLKSGVYFLNLNSVDGKLNTTRKIVKF